VRAHPVAKLGEQWECVGTVVLGYWTNRTNFFKEADKDASALVDMAIESTGVALAPLLGKMSEQLRQALLIGRLRTQPESVTPCGESGDFLNMMPNRCPLVATIGEPRNEPIEEGACAPGSIPRDG
jgi:hypothetical protein